MSLTLDQCYKLLQVSTGASLEAIEIAYRRQLQQNLRRATPDQIQQLKTAYAQLKLHTQAQVDQAALAPAPLSPSVTPALTTSPEAPPAADRATLRKARLGDLQAITAVLKYELYQHLKAQVTLKNQQLLVQLPADSQARPAAVQAQIRQIVQSLQLPELPPIQLVGVAKSGQSWQKDFAKQDPRRETPFNRFTFDSTRLNLWSLPIAVVVAAIVNLFPPLNLLHLPWHIWIHEFGHATVAWLCGHRATPLPFGWTNYDFDQSWFVYFGFLFLFGLLFWSGWRERLRWAMGLAVALALLQLKMTWFMSERSFEFWFYFGGIGGEFWISTLLLTCFYFPLPDRLRWDIWRFPVVAIAASSLWRSFWQWHRINRGQEEIPWGTLFGGQGDAGGDMNTLNYEFGWSPDQIINAYSNLGNICVVVLLGVYVFFLLKGSPEWVAALKQRYQRS
jgi:hypothetical protein